MPSLACRAVRRPLRLLLLALVALVPAGCVTARAEVQIDNLGMAEGFAEAIIDRDAVEAQGLELDEVLSDLDLTEYVSTPGVTEGNRVELVITRDDEAIVTVRFADVAADDIAVLGGDPLISIAPDGSMTLDTEIDPSTLGDASTADLAVEFPFEVVETDGELDGSTVRWRVETGDDTHRLFARTNTEPYLSSPASLTWVAGGAVAMSIVVVLGGFTVWRWTRHAERQRTAG